MINLIQFSVTDIGETPRELKICFYKSKHENAYNAGLNVKFKLNKYIRMHAGKLK